jgi:hypothetical protein
MSFAMVKAAAEKVETNLSVFSPMTDRERREAIEKVKAKIASLAESADSEEKLDARVRLLQLWNALITLRPTDYVERVEPDLSIEEAPISEDAGPPDESSHPLHAATPVGEMVEPEASHASVEDVMFVEPKRQQTDNDTPQVYGPFLPSKAVQLSDRIRLRMVKEGILMNRRLPPGTVVLVYPLDGEHLIEQGIAEILEPHAEVTEPTAELLEF